MHASGWCVGPPQAFLDGFLSDGVDRYGLPVADCGGAVLVYAGVLLLILCLVLMLVQLWLLVLGAVSVLRRMARPL